MKLIWTRELDVQNPWEPDFHGVFFYQESGISFYYKDEHLVRCVHGQMDEPEILFEGNEVLGIHDLKDCQNLRNISQLLKGISKYIM